MNYLAHAYLSFGDSDILIGNMISDFVKGSAKFSYSPEIQNGIMLHRMIDTFTDDHPVTKQAKEIFRPRYRLYSGPIVDILYDHFLANDASSYPKGSLASFASSIYITLEEYTNQLPLRFRGMLPFMKRENWLLNYSTNAGMEKSLRGLARRSTYLMETAIAYHLFEENYSLLKQYFHQFFPDVKSFAKQNFDTLVL